MSKLHLSYIIFYLLGICAHNTIIYDNTDINFLHQLDVSLIIILYNI